jgi:hypothetical protein
MFKHLLFALLTLVSADALRAEVILTLNPTTISGAAGQVIGWGFTLTADPLYWVTVSSALIDTETNPALGFFSDWISLAGGPDNGVLTPGGSTWSQSYSAALFTGFGEYAIDGGAVPGDGNSGSFLLIYRRYSADPNLCGSCFIDTQVTTAPFGVNVEVAAAPEPPWTAAIGLACLAAYTLMRRRSGASSRSAALERPFNCLPPVVKRRWRGGSIRTEALPRI